MASAELPLKKRLVVVHVNRPTSELTRRREFNQVRRTNQVAKHVPAVRIQRFVIHPDAQNECCYHLDHTGLLAAGSNRQPSGGSIGAIVRSGIEGNRSAWGGFVNGVDDGFEYWEATRR